MDMNAEVRAAFAYARIRGNVREGRKPMPHWDDLQEVERELLRQMWYLGAEDAMAALAERMNKEPI
jgi:hypothetical protein